MSAPSTYYNNRSDTESVEQCSGPYWSDHYNHLYHQYQNFCQPPHVIFDHRDDVEKEEEFVYKRLIDYDKMNIKLESEDSVSCDEQRHSHCNKSLEHIFNNSPSRFYSDLHLNNPHSLENNTIPPSNEHAFFDQMKLGVEKTRLPPFQHPYLEKFVEEKDQLSPRNSSPFQEEYLEYPKLSSDGSPNMLPYSQEEPAPSKFLDMHVRPPFTQQHLRNYSVEPINNGPPLKTPVAPPKNFLPVDDNRIFPWMKTSFHKGIFLFFTLR